MFVLQSSHLVYEWSDGTNYDYKVPIKDPQKSEQKSRAGCVYISPSGEWTREDCSSVVEGALCYTTNTTTPTQSKTPHPASGRTVRLELQFWHYSDRVFF